MAADMDVGREWTIGELRSRDWDALHQLWWVCVKERNRLATEKIERRRLEAGYGDHETKKRDETVQKTMKAILDTLAERQQAYTEAYELAKHDPAINLSRVDGPQFTEPAYVCMQNLSRRQVANRAPRTRSSQKTTTRETRFDRNLIELIIMKAFLREEMIYT